MKNGVGRPTARGKFLFAGSNKLYVRGATYGAFRPDEQKQRIPGSRS